MNVFSGGTVSMLVQGQHITVRLPRDVPDALRGVPPAPGVFIGRESELADVAALLAPIASDGTSGGCAVSVVAGMAGVGKSALALRVAHDLVAAGWFTGGAMFLGLRGYDAGDRLDADTIAVEMLGILGVPGEVIPAGAQARLAVLRTVLAGMADAGHRVLIVLDDVSSSEQILPVLPGTGIHPVLVTSRHTLTGLDAPTTELPVLPDRAAFDLLAAALQAKRPGDTRLRRNTRAVRALVGVCAGLPLALRIVAGRLATSPDLTPAALAEDLADGARRLDGLDDGERAVRAALDLSYTHLLAADANAARVFRLAAESPGATFTVDAAAALSGLDRTIAMRALAELERAHLVEPAGTDRRRMHDLVRLHAHSTPDPDRERAVPGLLAYYGTRVGELAAAAGTSPVAGTPEAAQASAARKWFAAERDGLQAALEHAAAQGDHDTVITLAFGLHRYLNRIRDFAPNLHNLHLALEATEVLSRPYDAARALTLRGNALREVRRFEEAITAHERVRDLCQATDDPHGQARAWNNLGIALGDVRRFEEAIASCERARDLFEATDDRHGQASAWNGLGAALGEVRRFEEAITAHGRARDLFEATDDPHGQASAWTNLGIALGEVRRFEEAITAHGRARDLYRATDDPHGQASAWNGLGIALREVRRFQEAITAHERARDLFEATDDPHGRASAWTNLGNALGEVRRFEEAITAHERARDLYQATDDPNGQAAAWNNLGNTLREVPRFEEAITACERARDLFEATGDSRRRMAVEGLLRSIGEQVEAIEAVQNHAVGKTRASPDLSASGFTGSLNLLFPNRKEPPPSE
ncbi:tetratricopeptide repeat protein [Embleya sp. NPDC127516]|uniref:tetratricopeptide repeat protein n=1 Tax=Embleya sp. NPDC127516 TaxID=3363990 RepID=UPI003809061D